KHEMLLVDVPGDRSGSGPARDQRHVIARKRSLAEQGSRVGEPTLKPQRLAHLPGGDGLAAVAVRGIEIEIGESRRAEKQFIVEPHVIDAGLQGERAVAQAYAALDVVRGLGLEVEVGEEPNAYAFV